MMNIGITLLYIAIIINSITIYFSLSKIRAINIELADDLYETHEKNIKLENKLYLIKNKIEENSNGSFENFKNQIKTIIEK